jgi:hypothetical protein
MHIQRFSDLSRFMKKFLLPAMFASSTGVLTTSRNSLARRRRFYEGCGGGGHG